MLWEVLGKNVIITLDPAHNYYSVIKNLGHRTINACTILQFKTIINELRSNWSLCYGGL